MTFLNVRESEVPLALIQSLGTQVSNLNSQWCRPTQRSARDRSSSCGFLKKSAISDLFYLIYKKWKNWTNKCRRKSRQTLHEHHKLS